MNSLTPNSSELSLSNCSLTKTSLIFKEEISFDQWELVGAHLRTIAGSIQFWIGDWLNHGEKAYGQKYLQAMEMLDKDIHSLECVASICRRVEISRRRELLSFSHHAEAAKLDSKQQIKWLKIAEEERLSVRELRESIRSDKIIRISDIERESGKNSGFLNIEGIVREALIWKRTVIDADTIKWTPDKLETLDRRVIQPLKELIQVLESKRLAI